MAGILYIAPAAAADMLDMLIVEPEAGSVQEGAQLEDKDQCISSRVSLEDWCLRSTVST